MPEKGFKEDLKILTDTITDISRNINQMGRELAANQQSTTGLWHEVRQVGRRVEKLPGQMREMIGEHEDDCLARERIKKKMLTSDSNARIPMPDANSMPAPIVSLPKWAIYIALLIGALLVGGGVFVGAILYGKAAPAEVIRDLGEGVKDD